MQRHAPRLPRMHFITRTKKTENFTTRIRSNQPIRHSLSSAKAARSTTVCNQTHTTFATGLQTSLGLIHVSTTSHQKNQTRQRRHVSTPSTNLKRTKTKTHTSPPPLRTLAPHPRIPLPRPPPRPPSVRQLLRQSHHPPPRHGRGTRRCATGIRTPRVESYEALLRC